MSKRKKCSWQGFFSCFVQAKEKSKAEMENCLTYHLKIVHDLLWNIFFSATPYLKSFIRIKPLINTSYIQGKLNELHHNFTSA